MRMLIDFSHLMQDKIPHDHELVLAKLRYPDYFETARHMIQDEAGWDAFIGHRYINLEDRPEIGVQVGNDKKIAFFGMFYPSRGLKEDFPSAQMILTMVTDNHCGRKIFYSETHFFEYLNSKEILSRSDDFQKLM